MIVAPVPWDVGTALVSMGVEEVSFVCLEAGGLAFGVWESAKKSRRLPSHLKGPDFQPVGAMVEGRARPVTEAVVGWGQERVWVKNGREGSCTLGVGVVLLVWDQGPQEAETRWKFYF